MLKRGKFRSIQSTFNLQSRRFKRPEKAQQKINSLRAPSQARLSLKEVLQETINNSKNKRYEKGKYPSINFVLAMLLIFMKLLFLIEGCSLCQVPRVKWSLPLAANTDSSTWYSTAHVDITHSACRARARTDVTNATVKKMCVVRAPCHRTVYSLQVLAERL